MRDIIEIASNPGDIVLDFFGGSGTTAAVALIMKRQFIIIEQMDYAEPVTKERLVKVVEGDESSFNKSSLWEGGGSFIYAEIAKDNARFVDLIEKATDVKSLKAIWGDMVKKGFLSYRVDESKVFEGDEDGRFSELTLDEQKQVLIRTLDLNQLYVNYSEIDDERYNFNKTDKILNKQFYDV